MSDHAFKLAVCQIRTELDKKLTMDKAERMVCEAAGNGANVVVLPEMYNCPYSKKYFQAFAAAENGESVERMSAWARENGKLIVSGSDFHTPAQLARGGIIAQSPIRNNADLLDTLRSMDFEMIKTY